MRPRFSKITSGRRAAPQFQNSPTPILYETNRRSMKEALAKVRQELGREYDLVIGGQSVKRRAQVPID